MMPRRELGDLFSHAWTELPNEMGMLLRWEWKGEKPAQEPAGGPPGAPG